MPLDEVFSQFNVNTMRNQLSEANMHQYYGGYQPYHNGYQTPLAPQFGYVKEEYRNAHMSSYAEKLDLLLEAQENANGRPEINEHIFEQCRIVQKRFLAKLLELERGIARPLKDIICTECTEVKRECDSLKKEIDKAIGECEKLAKDHELVESELKVLRERYDSEGQESVRTLGEASAEIRRGKDGLDVAEKSLLEIRLELEQLLLLKAKTLANSDFGRAEEVYHSLVHLRRQILKCPDPDTDSSVDDDIIFSYRYEEVETQIKQGASKHSLAETFAHALYVKKLEVSSDTLSVRQSFQQWCRTLRCQDLEKKCRAEQMYREIWFFKTGKEERLWKMQNGLELAEVLRERGEKTDAKSQYRRVWDSRAIAAGADGDAGKIREIACTSGHELGSLLMEEKSYKAAADRLRDVWEARNAALSEYDSDTIATAELLLAAYQNMKDSMKDEDKEEALCLWIWNVYKNIGSGKAVEALSRLATLQLKREKHELAAASFKELWETLTKSKGSNDVETLEASYNYCVCLVELKKCAVVKPIIQENWELRKVNLPLKAQDIQTLASGHLYGLVLARIGPYNEAEAILKEIWTARKNILPRENQDTLNTAHEYGVVLLEHNEGNPNKLAEARSILEYTWKGREKVLGAGDAATLSSAHQYIIARLEQRDLTGLDVLARNAFEAEAKAFGERDLRTLDGGLVYGTALLMIADLMSPQHREAGRRQGIDLLRHLWKGRGDNTPVVLLDIGFSFAGALLEVGGSALDEARAVIEEVVRRLPKDRVARFMGTEIKNPVVLMKEEINKRWEEWKNPSLRPKELSPLRVDSKGRSKDSSSSGSDYKGSTRSSRKVNEDSLRLFRHFARNW